MKRRIAQYIFLTIACAGACAAQYSAATGWCEQGGGTISVNSISNNPPTKFQRSYPQCTVTVYMPGTTTKVALFSNSTGTTLANPFTSSTTGQWLFYVPGGDYDVQFSGIGVSAPFTVRSIHVSDNRGVIDVTAAPYFAKCDGTTDDSVGIRAAVAAAGNYAALVNATSKVIFPAATCLASLVILPSNVWLAGVGVGATTLKLPNSANVDVIQGANFLTLDNTPMQHPEARGANFITITDMTIDGNKANNSAGYCIRIWGHSMYWENLTVQNCGSGGIFTEYSDGSGPASFASNPKLGAPESFFHNIKSFAQEGNDWTYNGPNDGVIDGFVASGSDGWGLITSTKIVGPDIYWVGTLDTLANMNLYGAGLGGVALGADATIISMNAVSLSSAPVCLQMDATTGSSNMSNMILNGCALGALLEGSHNSFTGQISRNTVGIRLANILDAHIVVNGDGNATSVDVVSESNGNTFSGIFNVPVAGTLVTYGGLGHFNAHSTVSLSAYGDINCTGYTLPCVLQIPGLMDLTTTPGQAFLVASNPATPTNFVRIYHTGAGGNGGIDNTGTGDLILNGSAPTKSVHIGSGKLQQDHTYTIGAGAGQVPSCAVGLLSLRVFATDLTGPTFLATAAGGGSAKAWITCDGTNWIVE